MRSEGYSTWSVCLCVCVSVCLSVCLLLNISLYTWLFVPQTIVTFPAADEGRKLSNFLWKCFVMKLERFLLVRLRDESAIVEHVAICPPWAVIYYQDKESPWMRKLGENFT